MSLSFKSRIALNYVVATAIVVAIVFFIIMIIVKTTVYYNVDNDLSFEADTHMKEIKIQGDSIHFINILEWSEREHREVEVHPVFIQIVNKSGQLMDKSPNLKDAQLKFEISKNHNEQFNTTIKGKPLRQIQLPIKDNGEIKGYILAAMSMEDAQMVILKLKMVLLILYPIVLLGLFGVARYLAGRSIYPIRKITTTANHITRNNLNERIDLPKNKDELFTLASSINELLQRMEEALEREKQFTSDASHELRTPLAILKGTLEVLNRKPRTALEYKEKIAFSINEIDRMSVTVEQLLMLARVESSNQPVKQLTVEPLKMVDHILERYKEAIKEKSIAVNVIAANDLTLQSDPYYLDVILDNLISNSIKYSNADSSIDVVFSTKENKVECLITDRGIGIESEYLDKIFNPFFRTKSLYSKEVKGDGLGLPIVKKACQTLGIDISYQSELSKGTTVKLLFPQ